MRIEVLTGPGASNDELLTLAGLEASHTVERVVSQKARKDEPETYTYAVDVRAADAGPEYPLWQPIQPAAPVRISPLKRAQSKWSKADDCNELSQVGADPQFGFRLLDGMLHPFHSVRALDVFIQVAQRMQPNLILILGDFMDLPSQGRFAQEASFALTMQASLDAAKLWLAQLRAAAPEARIVIIEGNHDKRMQRFVEDNFAAAYGVKRATLEGRDEWPTMSLPYLLALDEIDVEYIDAYPAATFWLNERTKAIHGTKANSRGSTTASYLNEAPHLNIAVGHTHRQEITWRSGQGELNAAMQSWAMNPGALCRIDGAVPSVHGAIHVDGTPATVRENWQQGFGLVAYNANEEWPSVHPIIDGRAIIPGTWEVFEAPADLRDDDPVPLPTPDAAPVIELRSAAMVSNVLRNGGKNAA